MDQDEAIRLARQAEFLLDQEIERLNNLKTEDYEVLREKRLQLLKLQHQQEQIWLSNGHGSYRLQDELMRVEESKEKSLT